MASTSEWLHNYHQNTNNNTITPSLGQVAQPYAATSSPDLFFSGLVSEATAVVSTPLPPGPAQLGPEGRVNKPARRRTRASRRTPTTLLNTDTTNFRAMVQQFTGGPSNSFPTIPNLGPQGFNIGPGLGYGLQYSMGQIPCTTTTTNNNHNNATTMSSSSTNNNNMFMQRNNIMLDNIMNNNNNNNAYVGNNVNGGSSSSDNRSSNSYNNNNFQF